MRGCGQNSLLPHEIVLVQDGPVSSDLLKVVDDYDSIVPLRLIQLDENMGLGHAMNVVRANFDTRCSAPSLEVAESLYARKRLEL